MLNSSLSPASAESASIPASRWLDEHGDALYGFALLRVGDPHAAEDLVQETLLAGLAAWSEFAGRSAVRTWLTGILKHKVVDHLRRRLREAGRTDHAPFDSPDSLDFFDRRGHWKTPVASWAGDPQQLLESQEFRLAVAACLAKLPRRQADLFWLREVDGADTDLLCKDLAISPTNVWTLLHRARLRMRACLTLNWFGKPS